MTNVLICGSRDFDNYEFIENHLIQIFQTSIALDADVKILHGGARGVDACADKFAKKYNFSTAIYRPTNPAQTQYYLHRNAEMIGAAHLVVAFWNTTSRGTKFVIDYCNARDKPIIVIPTK